MMRPTLVSSFLLFLVITLIASLCHDHYTYCCKSISSSVVRIERPGNYLFKIESLSLLLQALETTNQDKYDSLHFDAGGHKWKLSLYPKGDKKRGGDGYVSLYLALVDPDDSLTQGEEIRAFVNFFVYDHLRDNYLVLQDGKEKRFHSLKTECGFEKLLPLEIFNDPSKGYLVDDSCVFGVDVFLNKIERQGGLSLTRNNLDEYESSSTWTINKFSTLPETHVSEESSVEGVKWALLIYPNGEVSVKGRSLSLYLCVHDDPSFLSGWNIYAEYKLSILDQLNQNHLERTGGRGDWFSNTTGTCWGFSGFLQLSDLKDSSRGFIINDTVVVQVTFTTISVLNNMI